MILPDLRRRAILLLAPVLLACPASGCKPSAEPPDDKVPPATVKWEGPLQSALEEWTELVGTTMPLPERVARITASVEGRVLNVLTGADGTPVLEGQQVEKGTVLVQLDTTIIKHNLTKLEALAKVSEAEEKQAETEVKSAQLDVDALKTLKPQDKSPLDEPKRTLALENARAKLQAARGRLAAGAREIDALKEQLRYYTLAAPIRGRLGRIQVVPGQTLTVGTSVAEVIDLAGSIDVLCFVPAAMVRLLKVGMTARSGAVEKGPNAPPEVEPEGRVEYIAAQAEPETGNFAVKVRLANQEAHLRANRVLRIRVLTRPTRECLSLPEAAVMEDEEPPSVVIVEDVKTVKNDDGKEETTGVARRLQVELGVRDRTLHQVEIVRLIDPEKDPVKKWQGDLKDALFVVEGGQGLQTGDAVKLEVENE
jgi:RND family efflux transporter MFP subunit